MEYIKNTYNKKIKVREGNIPYVAGHDALINDAKEYCRYGVRTDAAGEGVGYLGMDDLDRIRRRKLL